MDPTTCCRRCGPECGCPVPHCLDLSAARTSERGLYHAVLAPAARPVALGVPTAWTLDLTGPDARPLAGAAVAVDGGMPRRGLRFPGAPRVAAAAEPGRYRLTGLVFTEPGWWLVRLGIAAAPGADAVTLNLALE
ncbi:MAG TPA: FixH family protein [Gemmatimonadales bacterium]|nr:FixH family protein [Gemmatimonadales bacterium]